MDQRENQKQQSLLHGKFTQLVLSVSVFSLFHNIDKNCMFLLCNGLLVFLAKFSGFIGSCKHDNLGVLDHDDDNVDDRYFKCFEDVPRFDRSLVLDLKAPLLRKDEASRNCTTMDETQEEDREEDEEKDGEKWGLSILMENSVFVGEEDEDLKGLNKRFDEFIRKMKEELRIEARRQSIMA
ncbi:hypothetical protein GQ457_15G027090 [Hibiscus cannabinus]